MIIIMYSDSVCDVKLSCSWSSGQSNICCVVSEWIYLPARLELCAENYINVSSNFPSAQEALNDKDIYIFDKFTLLISLKLVKYFKLSFQLI